ncbi:helix-turn-helix domain-containing protein [Paenibacillus sp. TAF58]
MSNRVIDLSTTSVKSALKIMMAEKGIDSLADIARSLDVKETTFRSAINNESIRLTDFLKVAEYLGYTVIIQST